MAHLIDAREFYTILDYFPQVYTAKGSKLGNPNIDDVRDKITPWVYNGSTFIQRNYEVRGQIFTLTLACVGGNIRLEIRNLEREIVGDFEISPSAVVDKQTKQEEIDARLTDASYSEEKVGELISELARRLPKRT